MKIISLNIWGGSVYEPLMEFLKAHRGSTDVFCFQEVLASPRKDIETSHGDRVHILEELIAALPEFNHHFSIAYENRDRAGKVDFELKEGHATFFKKSISPILSGEIKLHSGHEDDEFTQSTTYRPRSFGYIKIPWKEGTVTIVNIHGFTFLGDDKLDRPERIEQSKRIKEFAENEKGSVVLCGDFNLLPETESIAILESSFVNLIKKFGIRDTRGTLDPWHGKPGANEFSDFVFVSPDLEVVGFEVPDAKISDHLPLILEVG